MIIIKLIMTKEINIRAMCENVETRVVVLLWKNKMQNTKFKAILACIAVNQEWFNF